MTAQELVLSILQYHVSQRYADYLKKGVVMNNVEKQFKDLESFIKYLNGEARVGDYEHGHYNIRITAKQAQWLNSLLRSHPGNALVHRGLRIIATNPKYPCNAGGGLVGKRADTSQWILKITRA